MPINAAAIISVIAGTPLCSGSLVRTSSFEENVMRCVMGELLHNVGATYEELKDINEDGVSGYWYNPNFQKYSPALSEKFGITSSSDVQNLVRLNDDFGFQGTDTLEKRKGRTCHIMKVLASRAQEA